MLDLLKFDITGNHSGLSGSFAAVKKELGGVKGALAGVNDYARRAGRSMRNIGAGMSAGITAPLTLLGKQSVQLYDQQVRAENTVQQAILSTGSAAGKTLADLKGLASGLQGLTTFGDEDILQNVTAPLLTFTKIQGEVFDRAQANVLDMSTLLKMDLKSASILVGKALNDPVKGLSALSRSGIQFSEDQKSVIKSLVETGQTAKAQSLILTELETQFGGQAAAAAAAPLGQWRQLGNAIGDVKEELGAQVVPFLKPLVDNVKEAVSWFAALSPEVKQSIVVVGGLAAAGGPLLLFLGAAAMGVGALTTAFTGLATAVLANPIIAAIALIAGGAYLIYRNWDAISGWFAEKWAAVKQVTADAWTAIKAKISEYAPDWLKSAWGNLGTWFMTQWNAVTGSVIVAWERIKGLLDGTYSPEQLIYAAWRGIGDWFRGLRGELTAAFADLWEAIKEEVSAWPGRMIQTGKDIVQGLVDGITGDIPKARQAGGALGNSIAYGTREKLESNSPSRVFMGIGRDIVQGLVIGVASGQGEAGKQGGALGEAVITGARTSVDARSPSRAFMDLGGDIVEGLGLGIRNSADHAISEMQGLSDTLVETGQGALGFMGSVRDGAKTIFRDVLTGAQSFRSSLAGVLSGLGNRLISTGIDTLFGAIWPSAKGNVVSGGRITPFADGGVVSSPTYFPMKGGTGLMGEAGEEAIMPLTRVGGKLGVRAVGGGDRVSLHYAPVIDARGADQAAVDRLEAQMHRQAAEFESRVHEVLRRGRNRRLNGAWQTT